MIIHTARGINFSSVLDNTEDFKAHFDSPFLAEAISINCEVASRYPLVEWCFPKVQRVRLYGFCTPLPSALNWILKHVKSISLRSSLTLDFHSAADDLTVMMSQFDDREYDFTLSLALDPPSYWDDDLQFWNDMSCLGPLKAAVVLPAVRDLDLLGLLPSMFGTAKLYKTLKRMSVRMEREYLANMFLGFEENEEAFGFCWDKMFSEMERYLILEEVSLFLDLTCIEFDNSMILDGVCPAECEVVVVQRKVTLIKLHVRWGCSCEDEECGAREMDIGDYEAQADIFLKYFFDKTQVVIEKKLP